MKWKRIYPDNTTNGAHRVVDRFLWWPLRLGDETRWLEYAPIVQLFGRTQSYWNRGGHWADWKWAKPPVENLSIPGVPVDEFPGVISNDRKHEMIHRYQ